MLQPVADDLWTTARHQKFWGLEVGTRMTIARLSDGSLFVHCPVALDAETRRDVEALGPVRAVVSSNLFHHLYAGEWIAAYPKAELWGCPGLAKKRPDLAWTGVLGDGPHDAWKDDLDQAPFTSRFEKEIVFFHRKSRTFVCADALLNVMQHPSPVTRAVGFVIGNWGPGRGCLETHRRPGLEARSQAGRPHPRVGHRRRRTRPRWPPCARRTRSFVALTPGSEAIARFDAPPASG